jgi:tRNA dimethylallyltransferase
MYSVYIWDLLGLFGEEMTPSIVILGPTASGKTRLAALLASKINGEIISADSRQVYRRMDIGTGKDYDDYIVDNQAIKHHLIDIIDAGEQYHIAQFQKDFQVAFDDISRRNKIPILCGGSGMYLDAVIRNYEFTHVPVNEALRASLNQKTDEELLEIFHKNPSEYSKIADISTRKRLIRAIEISLSAPFDYAQGTDKEKTQKRVPPLGVRATVATGLIFGISIPPEIRRERIDRRLTERLQNGMIEEVQDLLKSGIPSEKLIFYGLEYKFITEYLVGNLKYDEMVEKLRISIHQFAKRQMTYFRGMERKGLTIKWLDGMKSKDELVEEVIFNLRI